MWAITSYYNPARYQRRLTNYKIFRANLGVPLVTVELSFDNHFELADNDADILIQISGGAIVWQKERLLNLAVKSVPPDVDKIAWIDCDVIFERSDWADDASRKLDAFHVIQLFSHLVDLNPEDHRTKFDYREAPFSRLGFISLVSENKISKSEVAPAPGQYSASFVWGLAWAARRKVLEDHGLYDALIVDGGDRALIGATYGQFEKVIEVAQLNGSRQEHYLKWARPFYQAVGERIGHIAGRLYHLWHGDFENRHYRNRHLKLASFDFEPDSDLLIGENGAWQWARSRPDLEEFLVNYFTDRAEDG